MGRNVAVPPVDIAAATAIWALGGTEVAEKRAVTFLVDSAITHETLDQYSSRVTQLLAYVQLMGIPHLTLGGFANYLCSRRLVAGANDTADGYRCAILHFQRSRQLWLDEDGTEWAGTELCIKICKGYKYRSKTSASGAPKKRGTIDSSMYPTFLEWILHEFPALSDAVELGYGTGLRSHALVALHDKSYDSPVRKLEHKSKVANAANGKPFLETTIVTDQRAHDILVRLTATTRPGELLFPIGRWNLTTYRTAMKMAAVVFFWPTGLKFDGPHCLRHGHVSALVNDQGLDDDEIQEQMTLSKPMIRRYGKTNAKKLRSTAAKKTDTGH